MFDNHFHCEIDIGICFRCHRKLILECIQSQVNIHTTTTVFAPLAYLNNTGDLLLHVFKRQVPAKEQYTLIGRSNVGLILCDIFHKLRNLPVSVRTSLNMICIYDIGQKY